MKKLNKNIVVKKKLDKKGIAETRSTIYKLGAMGK